MNEVYEEKGIKKEYSVPRTPQQNKVAERRNRTLIEAARTMLADSKLPTTFWAEAVNTACYVQNRVLVVKPHFKTPYELFKGRSPALSFMRPFGCHVIILNTLDQLGKFNGKSDEGIFVGYSTISKAFRVYNTKTRKVERNLHINFLKNKPMITGGGPEWLFDIDALSKSMNYAPVPGAIHYNDFADSSLFDSSSQDSDGHNKDKHGSSQASETDKQVRPNTERSTKTVNTAGPVNTATPTYADYPSDPLMPDLEDPRIFDDAYDDRDEGVEADYNNLETRISISPIPSTRIHKDHPKEQIIREVEQRKDGIFLSQDKYVCDSLKKFGFSSVKSASTPMETHKPLSKDEAGTDVDVHLYRYLKGQPSLGLWYPKDSPLELIAYYDSDYAGASLDRKSTTGGCQFL
nr:retrovirus-related Pol polyprotein from transposon TNT 1-94 [Tanacetum cinerariifolium]